MQTYKVTEEEGFEILLLCLELGKQQFDEVVGAKGNISWNLDLDMLKLMSDSGLIHLVVARDADDTIVGYFCNLINLDLFTKVYQAKEVAIFVHPDHRKTGVFKLMLEEMEELLICNGVKVQHLAFQKGHNETMPLKFGYQPLEIVYEKILGE